MADKSNSQLLADGLDVSTPQNTDLFYISRVSGGSRVDRVINWEDLKAPLDTALTDLERDLITILNTRLNLSGGTMSGAINMNSNLITNLPAPSDDNHAARKKYVDDGLATKLNIDGSNSMSSDLNMDSNKIINVTDPTNPQDAATKAYTDSLIAGIEEPDPLDLSSNPNYPASTARESYRITNAGNIGGGSGPLVDEGSLVICHTTNAGGDHATVGSNFIILQSNILQATTSIQGKVALSTNTETQNGASANKAVTPASLESKTATESRKGIAEIATQSETNTGTDDERIVTPKKLQDSQIGQDSHTQNSDTILDEGGPNEITAEEIKNSLRSQVKAITGTQLQNLHTTPVEITSAELGLSAGQVALIQNTLWLKRRGDGGNYTMASGNIQLKFKNESLVIGFIPSTEISVDEDRNWTRTPTSDSAIITPENTGFEIEATTELSDVSGNNALLVIVFYKIITVS